MLEDDYAQNIIANMDEETKRRFENGELSDGELKEMGLYQSVTEDYGEEGEFDMDEEEEYEEEEPRKRQKKN